MTDQGAPPRWMMTTVAIPIAGHLIVVPAERITAHLALHPAPVVGSGGVLDYDHSAAELTHTPSGALVCQIADPLTVRPGAVRDFARWLETVCTLADMNPLAGPAWPAAPVRVQIRRFVECPNHWRQPTTRGRVPGWR